MPPVRACSECGEPLQSRSVTARTCSERCRKKRSLRNKRATRQAREEGKQPAVVQEIRQQVRNLAPDEISRVMHEELRPIVRDALTEDVLRSVQKMLGLSTRAVELIAQDLESDDATVRSRAYTLITKYTIGHPALLQPKNVVDTGQMVVNFNLPRPDTSELVADGDIVPEFETKVCDHCNLEKPSEEFESGSERCKVCFDELKAKVLAEFGA